MSKVTKWNERTIPAKRVVDVQSVPAKKKKKEDEEGPENKKRAIVVGDAQEPRCIRDDFKSKYSCLSDAGMMASIVPYAASKNQALRSPFCVSRERLALFNNFNMTDCVGQGTGIGPSYPLNHFCISHVPAHNTALGRRLNSSLFNVESGGYTLSVNGTGAAQIYLVVGDRVTFTYSPGDCRRRRRMSDEEDFICITTDRFGGGPFSFTNSFSPDPENSTYTPSLEPEPVFGTQRIYRGGTETLFVTPWMAWMELNLIESGAVGTYLRINVVRSDDDAFA